MGAWQHLSRRCKSSVAEYKFIRNRRLIDYTVRIRPMKILCDPTKESLFFARNIAYDDLGITDWLAEVFHRCHEQVCTRDRVSEKEHFDPFTWFKCPVEKCHFEAFEMAGGVTMFVPGTVYHPVLGVAQSRNRATLAWRAGYESILAHTGGINIFSVPNKALEYESLEWVDQEPYLSYVDVDSDGDPFNMEMRMSFEKFMAGARSKNVTKEVAAYEYVLALERSIRPAIILHRFSLCKGDICWFPPLEQLRQLNEFVKKKMPLWELLEKLELPDSYIEDSGGKEEGVSYKILQQYRSLAINIIPADGVVYHPIQFPASYIECKRGKDDALFSKVFMKEELEEAEEADGITKNTFTNGYGYGNASFRDILPGGLDPHMTKLHGVNNTSTNGNAPLRFFSVFFLAMCLSLGIPLSATNIAEIYYLEVSDDETLHSILL